MTPAPPWVGYGHVGRKYSLLDRPLDVVPDCHPDFGLRKHLLQTSRRRVVTATLTVACQSSQQMRKVPYATTLTAWLIAVQASCIYGTFITRDKIFVL